MWTSRYLTVLAVLAAMNCNADPLPRWQQSPEQLKAAITGVRAGADLTPDAWPEGARVAVGLSFDVSVWEVWLNLMVGASVHMPEDEVRAEPRRLLQWLEEERITVSFMATPMAEAVLEEPWTEGVVLRWLFTGGDKLLRRPREELKAALVNVYGWDYFRDLAKNKLHIVQSANDPAGVVASGERPIGVNGAEYFYYKTLKQGNPIKIVYPKEGVPLIVSPVAIAKDAPHPNAAKLFTEFIFAKESQQLLADKEGLYTGHPDVTYPSDKPKLKDLKLLPADADELEKRNAEIKKRFVEYFGA